MLGPEEKGENNKFLPVGFVYSYVLSRTVLIILVNKVLFTSNKILFKLKRLSYPKG